MEGSKNDEPTDTRERERDADKMEGVLHNNIYNSHSNNKHLGCLHGVHRKIMLWLLPPLSSIKRCCLSAMKKLG